MTDNKHLVITLHYNLHKDTEKGDLIETTKGKSPLVFLTGVGGMIAEFENNVAGLKQGDKFSFGIKAENAYGAREEDAVMDLPKDIFVVEGKLHEEVKQGNVLSLEDDKGGMHPGRVLSIGEETITMDMNHLLAGQDLHFIGNVVEVRVATKEEIDHGHVHGEGGHQH